MMEFLEDVWLWLHTGNGRTYLKAVIIVVLGYLLARIIRRWIRGKKLDAQAQMIAGRLVSYGVMALAVIWALRELGFQLGALLGAAGLFTVAIGFAAKTSVSNLISGIFLVGERPFVVGDVISVGTYTGFVMSVDLMSVKLRTFDNLLVRIPNELLFKREVTNFSHFPIRRCDLKISVGYRSDLARVKKVLDGVADANPLSLVDPAPIFMFMSYGDNGLELQYSVWTKRENFLQLKTSITREIKAALDAEGVEIPYPQRTLHLGGGEPVSVQLVPGSEVSTAGQDATP
jgi:small-conductance mechanosensitive channel